jgi:hypothetical protein
MRKSLWIIFIVLCLGFFAKDPLKEYLLHYQTRSYPHFQDNPYLDRRLKTLMAPHLLPLDHPLKSQLDAIFSSRVTENETTLKQAGFTIIAAMPGSFVTVARHPAVPGYVFKLYLDSELRNKDGIPNCEWLARRCIGAETIRNLIHKKKMRHFAIPDKWLYVLPPHPTKAPNPQPVIVVETDMQLESEEITKRAWKTYVTPEHLDELYTIIKPGYGTVGLVRNIPYTKNGKFAFTDTEYPKRKNKLHRVKPYLSEEMQEYWTHLTQ